MQPIAQLPVTHLRNRIIGTKITLHNGNVRWAILGNIELGSRRSTEQFLTLSVERGGKMV
jgi:hypothetical protein